jgi:EpsI family protein
MDKTTKNFFLVAGFLALTTGYLQFLPHGQDVYMKEDILTLNTQVGDWKGEPHIPFSLEVMEKLRVDDYISRVYHRSNGDAVSLYVGYYRNQRQGELIHSPLHCLPGGGWNITKREIEAIPIPDGKGTILQVNRLTLQKDDEKMLTYYWYEGRGRVLTNEYLQKIYLVLDAIRYNRTDEALIRLLVSVRNDDVDGADQSLKKFTQEIVPILRDHYFPQSPGV